MNAQSASPPSTFALAGGHLGWLPVLSVVMAWGLLLMAFANWGSLQGAGWASLLFWIAILMIVTPVIARLLMTDATRSERIGLIVGLGLALYLVKVMHSPTAFTFADELVHYHNVNSLLRDGTLFNDNSVLPVTPLYPGLALVTSALANMTGLSAYAAGLFVIGVSRLIIVLALFLAYERLSRSARLAGIATVLYMANSNFMFWSAQYAYESFALPLATLVLFLLVLRNESYEGVDVRGIDIAYVILLVTVVVSHHMTIYSLTAFLLFVALIELVLKRRYSSDQASTLGYAAFALLTGGLWLFIVSPLTIDYLEPVLRGTISAGINLLQGSEEGTREIFESNSGFEVPLWERILGIGSVVLILISIPIGLLEFWKRFRYTPIAYALALAALLYFPIQALRLTGAGWETANRASEFLFIGIAFILALALVTRWLVRQEPWRIFLGTMFVAVLIMGGVIVGWDSRNRLAHPYHISVPTYNNILEVIEPQGVTIANWSGNYLGSGNVIATDPSNARLLLVYGNQEALAGSKYGIRDMLLSESIGRGEREVAQVTGLDYVVLARRFRLWDDMIGLYFTPPTPAGRFGQNDLPAQAIAKFDQNEVVSRILDSGDIFIYDVGELKNEPVD